ncbi:hypothetical protein LINPERPRIM_LOCUS6711 [Linum perenne]
MEEDKQLQQTIHSNKPVFISSQSIPSSRDQDSSNTSSSSSIPLVPLQVPNAFNYPERYKSPTDTMVSPITKGILARKRRAPAAAAAAAAGGGGGEAPLPPISPTTLFQGVD